MTILIALFITVAFITPAYAQSINPGCVFTWKELQVDNPNVPGEQIGEWELAGDLAGFQWVTNDTLTWDPLKMQLIDKAARTVTCSTVGVEAPGLYFVLIKSYDTSGNASGAAVLTFTVALEDTEAPAPVMEICLEGTLLNKPASLCAVFNTP